VNGSNIMQADRPLLTIAIPTYNRAKYLGQLLSAIARQLKPEMPVQVLVSDNASTDETQPLVHRFIQTGLALTYLRNDENKGPDANIFQCFSQASGTWVWIVGDDDIIVDGGIARVLEYLRSGTFSMLYLHPFSFSGDTVPVHHLNACGAKDVRDAHVYVERVHVYFTFISGNIVNKAALGEDVIRECSALIGTNLVQLGWVYAALNRFSRGLIIEEEVLGMRIENTGGYRLAQVFGPNLKEITESRVQDVQLQKVILEGVLRRFWPGILVRRRNLARFEEEGNAFRLLRETFGGYSSYWFFVFPIMTGPAAFAKMWWLVTRGVNKLQDTMSSSLKSYMPKEFSGR